MSLKNTILAATIAAVSALADFTPDYKLNTYWGQSGVGDTLAQYCASSSIDYVTLGFVNNSPDHGGGYPGTNFAAHCAADVYVKDGRDTKLLSGCSFIKEDIRTCQRLGKKVLLSIGGDYTDANNYSISTGSKGVEFANFMFEAFGPYVKGSTVPRPFDISVTEHTVLDGFDFDIETKFDNQDPYIAMIAQLRSRITTAGADMILTAAPQCPMDGQFFDMKNILINARFDKIWIQFYNNAVCDAINGGFNYRDWETFILGTVNAAAELYIGLPASPSAVNAGGYISPKAAKNLICEYKSYSHFGGAMLWDAHYGVENVNNGKTYYESVAEALKCGGCPGDVCAPTPPITTSSTSSSSITTSPSTSTLTTITATISTSSSVTSTSTSTSTSSSTTLTLTSSSATSTTTSSSVDSTAASTSSSVTSTSTSSSVTSTSAPTTSSSTSISISIPVTSSSTILTSISSSVTLTSTSSSATPTPTSTWSSSSTTSTSVSTSSSALSSTITSECTDEPTSSSNIISTTGSLTVTSPSSYSSSVAPYYSYPTLTPTYTVDTSSSSSAVSPSETTTCTDDISSTSSVGADTASPTASYPIVSSGFTTVSYTTSTVVTTKVYTVTSCAPTVTNCAASGVVVTETIPLYTTVCPVTETETAGATPTYQAGPPSYPIGGESSATYSFEASSYLVGSESSETYPVEATGYSEGSPSPSSYPEAPTYPVIVKVYPTAGTNSTLVSDYSHGYPTTTRGSGPSTTGYPGSGYPTVPVATAGVGKTVTLGLGGLIFAAFLAL
ncbi:glycoside hydrolase family 18 protein [Xylariaceae sp. AK1471]|nr:glycoside hydrolase family 18 protein [Xylariaceae sp. AK1471]